MEVIEDGHVYKLQHLESAGCETLTFIKRSSEAIDYGDYEHPGTNTQEVLRALINRTKYLNSVIPCSETQNAVYYLRMALYEYEARAYRRKQEKKNKMKGEHDDSAYMDASRECYKDIPFTEHKIEELPVGPDGHVIVKGK